MTYRFNILVLVFLCFFVRLNAQKEVTFQLVGEAETELQKLEEKKFKSKDQLIESIEKIRRKHVRKGYVLASVDSLNWDSTRANLYYYKGPRFDRMTINSAPEDAYLIRKIPRLSEKSLKSMEFKPVEIDLILASIVNYLQNNGYPFAKVKLDEIDIQADRSVANLRIDKGSEVRIAKIFLKGDGKINANYLTNYIAIKQGDLYSEERMKAISQLILQIPFINEIKPHELLFTENGVELYLYLTANPVSLINGVLGLQPNPVTGENVITGDVRLKLQNGLKKGELIDINWRSLQPQTQDLKMRFNYPFLFNSPFGIDGRFNLYRRDSTFLATQFNIGAQYFMRGGNYLKIFFESESSNPLSGASSGFSNLPNANFSAVNSNRYGIGLYRKQLDYIPNPSKGFFVEIDGLVGRRTSRELNSDTSSFSTTFTLRFDGELFLPLTKRHVIRFANQTRYYLAEQVFVNELYRFGGLTTQRGFDEEELFASSRSTFSVEYRFLVDQNSHAFAFFDQSFYENTSADYYSDAPFGTGAGFSFGTNLGIFSISYAVGKQFDNPVLLRNGKVHFGYVSYF